MTKIEESIMDTIDYGTFVKIVSDIPSCIFFKDADLKYTFSSHCWMQLISDDIIGKTDLEIRKDKENAIKAMEADREIITSRKGVDYVIKSDIDGIISYLQIIKEPIIDNNGKVIGIVGLINDVTDKTITEQKLEATNARLKNALETIQKKRKVEKLFSASMNHELRSPLNGIIGLLSLLLEDKSINDEQREKVFYAHESAELMLDIVNELLDFAKLESGEFHAVPEVFSMDAMAANIEYVTRNQADQKGLKFIFKNSAEGKMLVGDEKRIRQIISNLTSNAIKYTKEGWVSLGFEYTEGMLTIICEDSGQGMSEESLQSLFDPYSRFNEQDNKNIQGTGLGMYIVNNLIDKMRGTISVDSKLTVGTKFTVKIPLKQYESGNAIQQTKNEKDMQNDCSSLKVLCVDDAEINHIVYSECFKELGITIDKAFSGEEAIRYAKDTKYDIIFMDHMMPGIDGVEAMKIIHNDTKNTDTPVIMLTGNGGEEDRKLYMESGAAGVLLKPVSKEDLIKSVKSLLAQ